MVSLSRLNISTVFNAKDIIISGSGTDDSINDEIMINVINEPVKIRTSILA